MRDKKVGAAPVGLFDEPLRGPMKSFREVHLRLLMKKREDMLAELAEVDNYIFALEEGFRGEE